MMKSWARLALLSVLLTQERHIHTLNAADAEDHDRAFQPVYFPS
jgi:hypothetical protein